MICHNNRVTCLYGSTSIYVFIYTIMALPVIKGTHPRKTKFASPYHLPILIFHYLHHKYIFFFCNTFNTKIPKHQVPPTFFFFFSLYWSKLYGYLRHITKRGKKSCFITYRLIVASSNSKCIYYSDLHIFDIKYLT